MHIKELWRYAVKSVAGERLKEVSVNELGFDGDRKVLVLAQIVASLPPARTIVCWALKARLIRTASRSSPAIRGIPRKPRTRSPRDHSGCRSYFLRRSRSFRCSALLVATDGAIESLATMAAAFARTSLSAASKASPNVSGLGGVSKADKCASASRICVAAAS